MSWGPAADILVTGADAGNVPMVHVYDARGLAELGSFLAYPATFKGGVRVAAADVNADGVSDIITAPGRGMEPTIQVFDATAGAVLGFQAYDNPNFRGGVFVAAGDMNGDGTFDIITGPGKGMEPRVKVFDGQTGMQFPGLRGSFLAYDPRFRGGVRVAAADVNGDGIDDVIAGAGPGGSPEIRIFDGATGSQFAGQAGSVIAFNPSFRGGVFVATGDINGDGSPDILAGAGRVAPRVKVFIGPLDNSVIVDFQAYDANFRRGVRVAAQDVNGDGRDEIITGAGKGHGPLVRVFDVSLTSPQVDSFFTDELRFNHGVFVAATRR